MPCMRAIKSAAKAAEAHSPDVPFSSSRKMMATVSALPTGRAAAIATAETPLERACASLACLAGDASASNVTFFCGQHQSCHAFFANNIGSSLRA